MRAYRLSRLASVAPLVVSLVAVGCVLAPGGAGPTPAEPAAGPGGDTAARPAPTAPARTPAAGEATDRDGTDTLEEFRRDLAGARRIAEVYWKAEFTAGGGTFRPVRRVFGYTEEGEVRCAGEPLALNNAAYCPVEDFIAYDVNWAFSAFRRIGDAFVFYLVGHEYAHAIQLRLGIRKEFTIQQELQADCLAGAFLGDSERAGRLTLRDGDIEEFRRGLETVGDAPGQPWFAEGSHGSAEQRTEAFVTGYEGSLKECQLE